LPETTSTNVAAPETTSTTAIGDAAGSDGAPSCAEMPRATSPAIFDGDAGTYAALVTGREDLELRFDVVQWLTGDAALEAYHEANPDDPEGPPNDYFVVNDNEQVRTASLAETFEVWLVRFDPRFELVPGALPDFTGDRIYWLTFDDGSIVEVCEQYVP
jgi:hypothetical protein